MEEKGPELTTIVTPSASVKTAAPISPHQEGEETLTKLGQRKINLIWEYTQAIIAVLLVMFTGIVVLINVVNQTTTEVPGVLSNALFVVLTFYFARVNHTKIGGVGEKPYEGR